MRRERLDQRADAEVGRIAGSGLRGADDGSDRAPVGIADVASGGIAVLMRDKRRSQPRRICRQ